jgi:hypothetical protein
VTERRDGWQISEVGVADACADWSLRCRAGDLTPDHKALVEHGAVLARRQAMTPRTEVLADLPERFEEALRLPRRLEAPHRAGEQIQPAFAIVALLFNGLTLLGWRGLVSWLAWRS